MKYLALAKAKGQAHYSELGIVEADSPVKAEQTAVSGLGETDKDVWRNGQMAIKLYVLGDEFKNDKHVITQRELTALHDEEVQKSLSQTDPPEGGWPKGSDMDRL